MPPPTHAQLSLTEWTFRPLNRQAPLTVVQHADASLLFCDVANHHQRLRDGFFGGGEAAEPVRVGAGLYVFNELEVHERKNEGLGVEDHDEHVLPELDVADDAVEADLGPVFALEVVPDDHLVSGRRKHQHDEVRLVHHLNQLHGLVQDLDLLLQLGRTAVVLNDLEALSRRYRKVLLRLVRAYHLHERRVALDLLRCDLGDLLVVDLPINGLQPHATGLQCLRLGSVCSRLISHCLCCGCIVRIHLIIMYSQRGIQAQKLRMAKAKPHPPIILPTPPNQVATYLTSEQVFQREYETFDQQTKSTILLTEAQPFKYDSPYKKQKSRLKEELNMESLRLRNRVKRGRPKILDAQEVAAQLQKIELEKQCKVPDHYQLMLPNLRLRQQVSDSYSVMYGRIDSEVHRDIELILEYLTKISHKVDWQDDNVFDTVLKMRDGALKAAEKMSIADNPKWDQIARLLKQAALRGKTTGIFKVDVDPVPFWKQPQIVDGKTYFIDPQQVQALQNRPEANVADSNNPFFDYKRRSLFPVSIKDPSDLNAPAIRQTQFQIAEERDRMFCGIFTQILAEFQQICSNITQLPQQEQQQMRRVHKSFCKLLPWMNSKLAPEAPKYDHYLEPPEQLQPDSLWMTEIIQEQEITQQDKLPKLRPLNESIFSPSVSDLQLHPNTDIKKNIFSTQPSYRNSSSYLSLIENADKYLQNMVTSFRDQSYSQILRESRIERNSQLIKMQQSRRKLKQPRASLPPPKSQLVKSPISEQPNIQKQLFHLTSQIKSFREANQSRKVTGPVDLELFQMERQHDKTTKYQEMIEIISDMVNAKKQIQTFDILAAKLREEREESRLVHAEFSKGLSDPSRVAAKQEVKKQHQRRIQKHKTKLD